MSKIYVLIIAIMLCLELDAQYDRQNTSYKKHFIGSTLFLLGNFAAENKPDFIQINYGYRLSPKDAISIELKTWKYAWPLGIPLGSSFQDPDEEFPGYIREYGFALAYQHFWWKGLYSGIHVMNAWQLFVDNRGGIRNERSDGFHIFNTYRLGYHFKLFKDRFFIEPSIAITHRPYHTEMPDGFKQLDDKWSKFFFGEPGFHFGYKF